MTFSEESPSRDYHPTPSEPAPLADAPDEEHGRYLCETCFDAMTNRVLSAAQSPTGLEQAQCQACKQVSIGTEIVRLEQIRQRFSADLWNGGTLEEVPKYRSGLVTLEACLHRGIS